MRKPLTRARELELELRMLKGHVICPRHLGPAVVSLKQVRQRTPRGGVGQSHGGAA